MAKGAKRVAKESSKNPRYQTEGYRRSEERKKLTRKINRLNSDLTSGKIKGAANISNAQSLINELEQIRKESYMDKRVKTYAQPKERIANAVKSATTRIEEIKLDVASYIESAIKQDLFVRREYNRDASALMRKNKIFERELNQAGASSDVSVSRISKPEMKIFYGATMDIWKGAPSNINRNQLIMESLGVTSLEEAFDIIMNTKEAQAALKKAKYEQEPEAGVSPDYMDYLFSLL